MMYCLAPYQKPLLIQFSEKLVEMAARNKSTPLRRPQVEQVIAIYGLTPQQVEFYHSELLHGKEVTEVFGLDIDSYDHQVLEYVHSLLEGMLI